MEFLLRHGFDMAAPYLTGVSYLSRDEVTLARQIQLNRQDRLTLRDIEVKADDVETLKFLEDCRAAITAWVSAPPNKLSKQANGEVALVNAEDFLNIPEPSYMSAGTQSGLSNFQKRLVHQLVRAEFPGLVTIGRSGFIQIKKYDEEREASNKKYRMRRFEEDVSRQKGFAWVVEGMARGDLSSLDPGLFMPLMSSTEAINDPSPLLRVVKDLQKQLQSKPTVLVGHNLFTDLVNLYKCFVGPLPDRVEDFQRVMHEIFPTIIDTKYLATHECAAVNPKSSLEEIDTDLKDGNFPSLGMNALVQAR